MANKQQVNKLGNLVLCTFDARNNNVQYLSQETPLKASVHHDNTDLSRSIATLYTQYNWT